VTVYAVQPPALLDPSQGVRHGDLAYRLGEVDSRLGTIHVGSSPVVGLRAVPDVGTMAPFRGTMTRYRLRDLAQRSLILVSGGPVGGVGRSAAQPRLPVDNRSSASIRISMSDQDTPPVRENGGDQPGGDVALMDRIAGGDPVAFDTLVRRFWPALVAYAARVVGSADAAEDIVQDALLRIWQGRTKWRGSGSLRAFLYGVTRNLAFNYQTSWHQARLRPLDLASLERAGQAAAEALDPADALVREDVRASLERALALLPPRRREVFLLAGVHDLSYKEVARIMGIAPQTVANQMVSALAELRTALKPYLE